MNKKPSIGQTMAIAFLVLCAVAVLWRSLFVSYASTSTLRDPLFSCESVSDRDYERLRQALLLGGEVCHKDGAIGLGEM